MTSVATATAPSNIAFIKYWGARDLERAVPFHPSISMTLRRCWTMTTVAFEPVAEQRDEVVVVDEGGARRPAGAEFRARVCRQLDRLREEAGTRGRFIVATRNSFPAGTGLASSASGFAALTLAAAKAVGLELPPERLSSLARSSGSGSAARSVLGGYVEWPARPDLSARQLAAASHWDLRDVIAVVEEDPKAVPSLEGHRRAPTSPYFETRLRLLPERLRLVREAIARRSLDLLGPALEEEAIELHLVAMSSRPPAFYWKPGTVRVLEAVRTMREDGCEAWATLDAGANVHVVCAPRWEAWVQRELARLPEVRRLILDGVGEGPRYESEHLL